MAKKNFDNLLETFQGNAFPAMVEDLGRHLGVSAESLTRLALGWAPIVEFKKGPNFQGWWVIAERDQDGVPVGLSLRSQSDMKVMYPGSKHGLVFEVNPDHERGERGYSPGAQNWIRTAEAGVLCPVCDKPDGCLVSAEDPENPKAVTCIRVSEGSERPMRFGYLHILKPEGHLKAAGALADNGGPVIVVEGMTDTAAAMDLGFDAVGRPSNLAGLDRLADLIRGRDVIVLGENDRKEDGREPGREGMIACHQAIKHAAKSSKMVMPPEKVKDLRGWVAMFKLTAEDFLGHVESEGQARADNTVLPDNQPYTIAQSFLDDHHRMAGRYTLKYYNGAWYKWRGDKYVEMDEEAIQGPMYDWSRDRLVMEEKANGEPQVKPLVCNKSSTYNWLHAMLAPSLAMVDIPDVPAWVNEAEGPDPSDLIVFSNGILHVSRYLEGAPESEYLLKQTPDFFTLFALPFPFDPTAKCPNWKYYLRTTLGNDQANIRLLREWYGYCMTPDISMEKLMLMRGPTRSGKSTATAVLEALVGDEQKAASSLRDLPERFGLEGLVGSQIVVMGDVRMPKSGDGMRALETLLKISGGDSFYVDRKNKKPLRSHRFHTKFTISTNELPELPDNAGALAARLLILDFKQSFEGEKMDTTLKEKVVAEAPGIAIWALEGLRRLRENGKFTMPQDSIASLQEWRAATMPVAGFVEECCDTGDDEEAVKAELHECWNMWSKERGMRPISRSRFFERLRAAAPFVTSDSYEKGGHKFSVWRGISIKKWAAKQFLGKVGR